MCSFRAPALSGWVGVVRGVQSDNVWLSETALKVQVDAEACGWKVSGGAAGTQHNELVLGRIKEITQLDAVGQPDVGDGETVLVQRQVGERLGQSHVQPHAAGERFGRSEKCRTQLQLVVVDVQTGRQPVLGVPRCFGHHAPCPQTQQRPHRPPGRFKVSR